jgi:hypothetical protein
MGVSTWFSPAQELHIIRSMLLLSREKLSGSRTIVSFLLSADVAHLDLLYPYEQRSPARPRASRSHPEVINSRNPWFAHRAPPPSESQMR